MSKCALVVLLSLALSVAFSVPQPSFAQTIHKILITPAGTGPRLDDLGAGFCYLYNSNPLTGCGLLPPATYTWGDRGAGELNMCPLGGAADGISPSDEFPGLCCAAFLSEGAGGGSTQMGIGIYQSGILMITLDNYWINSPDINGDLVVDLIDISEFAIDLNSQYSWRSDLVPDGVLNLADVGIMATHLGENCF